jgi:hypothetical protein
LLPSDGGGEALVSESRRKERGGQLHWTGLDWTGTGTGLSLVTGLRTGLVWQLAEFGNWTENRTGLATG